MKMHDYRSVPILAQGQRHVTTTMAAAAPQPAGLLAMATAEGAQPIVVRIFTLSG